MITTYGVDTSHHQALGDFPAMRRSGRCDLLFAKATEGVGFRDPQYAASRAGAKAAGMLFGSYHFARPGDPVAQADYYLSVAKPVAGEIPILDIEDTAIPDAGNWGAAWCARVKAVTGTAPMVYTYPNYLATHDFRPVVALGCPLWFADYSDPLNPIAPWSSYAVRQFTDKGTVPGQPGTLDCNSSPLTLDQLRGYAIGGAGPTQEDDVDDATIEKISDRTVAKIADSALHPWSLDALLRRIMSLQNGQIAEARQLAAVAAAIGQLPGSATDPVDAQALAGALVPLLVPALAKAIPGASEDVVETALRNVLGSLDAAAS